MSNKVLNIQNKKAKFEYHLLEQYTAGIQLKGTEIKSIRNGKASIMEAYGVFSHGEVFLRNMYIKALLAMLVPAPDEPVTAIMGCFFDMIFISFCAHHN